VAGVTNPSATAAATESPTTAGPGSGITGTVVTNVAGLVVAFIASAVVARTLGPERRGAYAAVLNWPNFLVNVGNCGLQTAVLYGVARTRADARSSLTTGLAFATVLLVPITMAGWWLMPTILGAQAPETVRAARWFLVVYGVSNSLWVMAMSALQGVREFATWNAVRLAQGVLWLAMLIVASTVARTPFAYSLLFAMSFAIFVPWVVRAFAAKTVGEWAPTVRLARPIARYGGGAWLAIVPMQLNRRLDQLAMAAMVEPRILGLYAVASALSMLVVTVVGSIANVALPHVASLEGAQARAGAFASYMRLAVVASLLIGTVMLIATPCAVPVLFGGSYSGAIWPALVLVPATAVEGVNRVGEDVLMALGRPRRVVRAELAGFIVTVGGLAWSLPRFPLMGAAWTSLAAYSTVLAVVAVESRAATGLTIRELLVPRRHEVRLAFERVRVLARLRPRGKSGFGASVRAGAAAATGPDSGEGA